MQIPIEEIKQSKFGKLIVLYEADPKIHFRKSRNTYEKERMMFCKCDCGNEKIISLHSLRRNKITQSCGCLKNESAKNLCIERNTTHGLSKTNLYNRYNKMKERCFNPNSKSYARYGGRGIKVCDEWLNNFETFYNWSIENGYRKDLEIDRIDNDGDYEPGNCRWISTSKNAQNRSTTKLNMGIAKEIRNIKKYKKISNKKLANDFNISALDVSRILRNTTWCE